MAVDPASRGHGTGSMLVEAFVDESSRRGAKAAQVVVGQQNSAAVGVYSRVPVLNRSPNSSSTPAFDHC